jgi:hypothetical protein
MVDQAGRGNPDGACLAIEGVSLVMMSCSNGVAACCPPVRLLQPLQPRACLKAAMVAAQEETGVALGQMHGKVR